MVAQFVQMIEQLKACEKIGATTACLMQLYVYIDTFSYLGMPITKNKNTKTDFIEWVDKYLKADAKQSYQYRGKDVYGARCALLHTFSSEADYHGKEQDTIMYGYHDGGKHAYDPNIDPRFVMIGTASFINDFIGGVMDFIKDINMRILDENEKSVLQERLNKILTTMPL